MAVGDHITLFGIYDDPRTQGADPPFAGLGLRATEEFFEKGVGLKWALALAYPSLGIDIHHRGQNLLQHRRKTGERLTIYRQGNGCAGRSAGQRCAQNTAQQHWEKSDSSHIKPMQGKT